MSWQNILVVGLGGFIGAVLRYLISVYTQSFWEKVVGKMVSMLEDWEFLGFRGGFKEYWVMVIQKNLPAGAWGTISVNLLGCMLVGILFKSDVLEHTIQHPLSMLLKIGLVASFTTFSTFVYELILLYYHHHWPTLIFYTLAQVVGGVMMILVGEGLIDLSRKFL